MDIFSNKLSVTGFLLVVIAGSAVIFGDQVFPTDTVVFNVVSSIIVIVGLILMFMGLKKNRTRS